MLYMYLCMPTLLICYVVLCTTSEFCNCFHFVRVVPMCQDFITHWMTFLPDLSRRA